MKLCARAEVVAGQIGEITDISLVGDEHAWGMDEDGLHAHIEWQGTMVPAGSARHRIRDTGPEPDGDGDDG